MKKNKFQIILLLSFFSFSEYHAQSDEISGKQLHNVATPEIASIMRYSDFPELDFIGKTNISVPIYDINFGKLKIPIGLSYNTKGNKVADIATSVGLGWNLNAGGNLTLKVNDMNDFTEAYSYYTDGGFEAEQSYAWHRQSRGYLSTNWPSALDNTTVPGSSLCINHRIWSSDDTSTDAAPDFFYINAPGFNDKFYFTRINDTQLKANFFTSNAKLNNNPNLKIETLCTGFESNWLGYFGSASVFYKPEDFEITGENGYIYTFKDSELSSTTEYPIELTSHNVRQVNNWYLTKIKDPFSGKEITFEYELFNNAYEHPSLLALFNDVDFGGYPATGGFYLTRPPYGGFIFKTYNKFISTKLYPKRLKKIITDTETIEFNYEIARLDYAGNALSSVLIKNKAGNTIKQVGFNYSYFDAVNCSAGNYECKRLKLDKMIDSTLGSYSFSYDNNPFPPRNTSKIDFLGYFNNNSSNITFSKTDFHPYDLHYYPTPKTYFYPDLPKDNVFPFKLKNKTAYKIANEIDGTPSVVSRLGLLNKIKYPTGGSLELDYENDDFMYEGENYILGSTRVRAMRLYDFPNTLSKEIKYKYLNTDNTSSGQINFITPPEETVKSGISSGIGFNTGAIIGYSRIVEETTGKGYVEKKYTNFNDYPDTLMNIDQNFPDQANKNFFKFMKFPNSYVQSFDDRRGKLLSVNYYKEGQASPIKKEEYSYDYQIKNSLKVTKLFYGINNFQDYSASNYLLTYFNNPKTNTKEEFFSGGSVKEENNFSYDGARLISKKTINGTDTTEEFYRNAKDKSIQKLINANILDIPIEVEKRKNGKLLSKKETKYEHSYTVLPSSIVSSDLDNNIPNTEITYDGYDLRGNLVQYTTKDGISTVIVWGYNQTQPIAKIKNVKFTDIELSSMFNIMGASDIDAAAGINNDETALFSAFKIFRDSLPNYEITTYTYDPLVGVRSITPPSGIRENYIYDSAGRLHKIVDVNGQIVKEMKYNYKN
ncbi:hypothetical protein [Chryseobacterium sp.]|uniref:hypothetical protein n=1 Tax=Chryseobacterium sp. TaxID=1871047 RepID=UPI002602A990|nr:hypothetical protein [Chryseobacterium sp.]